jgi:hypothetical protein
MHLKKNIEINKNLRSKIQLMKLKWGKKCPIYLGM